MKSNNSSFEINVPFNGRNNEEKPEVWKCSTTFRVLLPTEKTFPWTCTKTEQDSRISSSLSSLSGRVRESESVDVREDIKEDADEDFIKGTDEKRRVESLYENLLLGLLGLERWNWGGWKHP